MFGGGNRTPEKPLMRIDELDEKFKITIDNGSVSVSAPLHDDFGFTVGSEYTTPFDTGTVSGVLQKVMAVGKVSSPVGLRMRKMYANPEPVELSFRMSFDAFYDAHDEVATPVITLVTMGLGRELTKEGINGKIAEIKRAAGTITNVDISKSITLDPDEGTTLSSKVMGLIKMVNAPDVCSIRFGEFMTIDKAFITSTAVSFSNIMDPNGIPMRADVNVTCTLEIAPIAEDVLAFFERD